MSWAGRYLDKPLGQLWVGHILTIIIRLNEFGIAWIVDLGLQLEEKPKISYIPGRA